MESSVVYDSRIDTLAHIEEVRYLLLCVVKEFVDRAHDHDKTKLESPEVEVFDVVTPRLRDLEYDSAEYHDCLHEMGPALHHHYSHTKHHPEGFARGVRGMSLIDLLEMVVDWMAAVKRHEHGDIRDSIEKNRDRFHYSDELAELLHNTVDAIEALA